MTGLIESARAILASSARQVDVVAHNVANISTPGFKRGVGFATLVSGNDIRGQSIRIDTTYDFGQGKLVATDNPLDMAISGPGFFQMRAGDAMLYSRQGQFRLDDEGRVVSPQGYVLQQAGGGDLVLDSADVAIADDGTVLSNDRPVARVALFASEDSAALTRVGESFYSAPETAMVSDDVSIVRQGMIEASNTSLGDEMVTMTQAVRQAETGARLIQVYDDLMGRAISTLGQAR